MKLHIHLLNLVVPFFFLNSANLICRVRISRSITEGPLEFEITRVDCNSSFYLYILPYTLSDIPGRCTSVHSGLQEEGLQVTILNDRRVL